MFDVLKRLIPGQRNFSCVGPTIDWQRQLVFLFDQSRSKGPKEMIFQAASGNYSRYLSCSDYHDMTVRVIGDGDIRVFKLHRIVLCNASGYFRDQVPKSGTKVSNFCPWVKLELWRKELAFSARASVFSFLRESSSSISNWFTNARLPSRTKTFRPSGTFSL